MMLMLVLAAVSPETALLLSGISILGTIVIPTLWVMIRNDRRRVYQKLDDCEKDRKELWAARERDKTELINPLIKLINKLADEKKEVVENVPIRNVGSNRRSNSSLPAGDSSS